MSVTLLELKQTLEKSMNAFVESRIVINPELNIRTVSDEIIKLYKTANNITSHYKRFYARQYKAEVTDQTFDVSSYLSEYRATNCDSINTTEHYGHELIDDIYNNLPPEINLASSAIIENITKTLLLKMENSSGAYQQGIHGALSAISNIKSSNLKAELYLIKYHGTQLFELSKEETNSQDRRDAENYASALISSIEIAEHMLPHRDMTSDEILDEVNFPRVPFDFEGHDVVLNCPGLKQTVLFMNAINIIEDFSSKNTEIAFVTSSSLKRPLLGQYGRDTQSIVQSLMEGKKTVISEIRHNDYLDPERKVELHHGLMETFRSIGDELKSAIKKGAIIPSPKQGINTISLG